MLKKDLLAAIAERADISKAAAERVLHALGDVTAAALSDGDDVTLPGIGRLHAKQRAARNGVNPRTGEKLTQPAKTVPAFTAAKVLKDALL